VTASRADWLTTPLQFVKGVGPRRAADLERVGLLTVEDLLLRFPLRYEDRASLLPIARLRPGTTATVAGEVLSSGIRPTRRPGFRLFELVVKDETGPVRAVFPNQAFLRDVFQHGQLVVLYGTVEFRGSGGLQLTNPEYEIIRGDADEDGRHRAHGPHRPDLRKGRVRHHAHATHARASPAVRDAGGGCGPGS
jgi:ATP-dependent DNA helicase RecG